MSLGAAVRPERRSGRDRDQQPRRHGRRRRRVRRQRERTCRSSPAPRRPRPRRSASPRSTRSRPSRWRPSTCRRDPDISGNNQNAYPALPVTRRRSTWSPTARRRQPRLHGRRLRRRQRPARSSRSSAASARSSTRAPRPRRPARSGSSMINRDRHGARRPADVHRLQPRAVHDPDGRGRQDRAADPARQRGRGGHARARRHQPPTRPTSRSRTSARPVRATATTGSSRTSPPPASTCFSSLNGSGWNGDDVLRHLDGRPDDLGRRPRSCSSAHPGWSPLKVKAAIVNTADASQRQDHGYDPLPAGSGVVQANRAVAHASASPRRARAPRASRSATSRSDGAYQRDQDHHDLEHELARDRATTSARAPRSSRSRRRSVKVARPRLARRSRSRASLSTLGGGGAAVGRPVPDRRVRRAQQPVGRHHRDPDVDRPGRLPAARRRTCSSRAASRTSTRPTCRNAERAGPNLNGATLKLANNGVHDGFADTYALGRTDPRGDGAQRHGRPCHRRPVASRRRSSPATTTRPIAASSSRSTAGTGSRPRRRNEVDIAVDTDGDGEPDYFVVGIDDGLLFAGAYRRAVPQRDLRRDDVQPRRRLAGGRAAQRLDADPARRSRATSA